METDGFNVHFNSEICQSFVSRRLFYPSVGRDIQLPIETFVEFIDEFWFVDVDYRFNNSLFDSHLLGLRKTGVEKFKEHGTTIKKGKPFENEIERTTYLHQRLNRNITVNACKGGGYDVFKLAFRKPGRKLSIFFHRGDSIGEGGSNFYWLRRPTIKYLLQSLEPGGLFITDGSNADKLLAKFHQNNEIGAEAIHRSERFTICGRKFACVGYLGNRYGPTLVWKDIRIEGEERS